LKDERRTSNVQRSFLVNLSHSPGVKIT